VLLHSFGRFSLTSGESATFTGSPDVDAVVGRITGGLPSKIDGAIRSAIPTADVFLLNPHGILLGPSATIDVNGALFLSTADSVQFGDGQLFEARPGGAVPTLLVSPPSSFGFLGNRPGTPGAEPAPISIDGSRLSSQPGQRIGLVGGDVSLGGTKPTLIAAPGGRIDIVSVASGGEVELPPDRLAAPELRGFDSLGDVTMHGTTSIDARGSSGGTVMIRGGVLTMGNDAVVVGGGNAAGAGDVAVDVAITGPATLSGHAALRAVAADEDVDPGELRVRATEVSLEDSATIDGTGRVDVAATDKVSVSGEARILHTGDRFDFEDRPKLHVYAGRLMDLEGGTIDAPAVFFFGGGPAVTLETPSLFARGAILHAGGHLTISAVDVDLSATTVRAEGGITFPSIRSASFLNGTLLDGSAEDVRVSGGSLLLENSKIRTSGDFFTPGIFLDLDSLTLKDDSRLDTSASFFGDDGGRVVIHAKIVTISHSRISTDANIFDSGTGGSVEIRASRMTMDHGRIATSGSDEQSGDIDVYADELSLENGSYIDSGPNDALLLGFGTGGDLHVNARHILLSGDGTGLFSRSIGSRAGLITVIGESLLVSNSAQISTQAQGVSFGSLVEDATAGVIKLSLSEVDLRTGGRIDSGLIGPGSGGLVDVQVARSFRASGAGSGVFADVANGQAGAAGSSIRISAPSLVLADGAAVSATSGKATGVFSPDPNSGAAAGDVTLRVGTLQMSDGASLSTRSEGAGPAGHIEVNASDSVRLANSTITTEALNSFGGSISINGDSILKTSDGRLVGIKRSDQHAGFLMDLVNSSITASVGSGEGDGGNIFIDPVFLVLQNSPITATAKGGNGGNILIQADFVFADRPLEELLNASSEKGVAGTILLSAAEANIVSSVTALPASFLDATTLLRQRCAQRGSQGAGSFVVAGTAGIASSPDAPLAAAGGETQPGPIAQAQPAGLVIAQDAEGHSVGLVVTCESEFGSS
jgi:filamentous hemagglutinin family protein